MKTTFTIVAIAWLLLVGLCFAYAGNLHCTSTTYGNTTYTNCY